MSGGITQQDVLDESRQHDAVPALGSAGSFVQGSLYRLAACACVAGMVAGTKLLGERGVPIFEAVFYRCLVWAPLILLWILFRTGPGGLRPTSIPGTLLRVSLSLGGGLLLFAAASLLPLAEATAISFSAPLLATCLSAVVLAERIGYDRWVAIVLGLAGVLLVVRPTQSDLSPIGVVLALLAALTVAITTINLRQMPTSDTVSLTAFWGNLLGLVGFGLAAPWFITNHVLEIWLLILATSVAGGLNLLLFMASLRHASVSALAPLDYSQLLWAGLLAWFIWETMPPVETMAGSGIIALSGFYTIWRGQFAGGVDDAALDSPSSDKTRR